MTFDDDVRVALAYAFAVVALIALDFIFVTPSQPGLGLLAAVLVFVMGAALHDKARHDRVLARYREQSRAALRVAVCFECHGEKFVRAADDLFLPCDVCHGEGVLR